MSSGRDTVAVRAEAAIVALLRKEGKRLTTRAISKANQDKGVKCPDSSVRFLTALRHRGVIRGEVSVEEGGWVWWVEEGEEGPGD